MFENIRLSFQGIWSHKMRSFLTMLGIIIGIAAIIAIVSTIKGTNEQIKENLIGSGENTVEVSLYQGEWEYEMDYNGVPQGVPLVTDEVMSDIKDLDHVVNASAYLSRQDYSGVYHLNTAFSGGYVRGIDNSYFDTCNYIMKEGRAFTDEDFKKYKKVAILDTDSANALFQGEDSVGNTIEIQKEPYTVIGIVTKAKVFEPVINSIDDYYTYAQDTAGSIYIPNTTWPIIYQYDEPQNVVIRVDSTDNMTSAGKACADVLNNYLSPKDDTIQYKAKDLLEQAQQIQELITARKYGIEDKMPILIAEKMGPHFAVGDTCYSWCEDIKVYNPNGKEIIARDNSVSIRRKEDVSKAYFHCHTDITIPYEELGSITVVTKDKKEIVLLENGKFVLPGTEILNEPLKNSNK